LADISIAKLVAPFSIKVDKAALAKVDEVLKKYSNKKIVQTVKVSTVVERNQKKELAGARALEAIDLRRFNAVKFTNALEKEKQKVLGQQLKTEERISKEKAKQALADTKSQAAWMRNTKPRTVGGQTINQRIANQLQSSGLRQTRGGGVARGGGSGTSTGQHALGLGRHSMGASYHGIMAGGGLLTGFGLSALNSTLKKLEAAPMGLQAATNSNRFGAQQQMGFVTNLAQEVGATRLDLIPTYTQFLAAAQGTPLQNQAQKTFRNLTRYGKALNLDPQSMIGGLKAIRQITSKGKLYAEEVYGQLGEHFAGAVGTLVDLATGDGTAGSGNSARFQKMMEKGQLDPYKLLPLLAEALGRKADATQEQREGSIDFAQGKARFAFESLLMKFGAGGGNNAFRNFWNEATIAIPKLEGLFTMLAGSATMLVRALGFISQGFSDIANAKFSVESSFTAIGAAALILGTTLGRAFLPLTAALAMLEDMAMYKSGEGRSLIGYLSGDEDEALRKGKYKSTPHSLRKPLIENPYDTGYDKNNFSAFERISQMIQHHPVVKGAASMYVGDPIQLSQGAMMDATTSQFLQQVGGVGFSPTQYQSESGATVVNITIDGITRKIEQERNSAGVHAVSM
jgi:hypothetical protein